MDCGPACLSSLLEGHGIRASYGRLREACQTDLDGTSIDTLEDAAVTLGLDAEQVMLPADHLLLSEAAALPALVVVRQPSGLTHFVIVWRRHGRWLQVMDPATGRRWPAARRFLSEIYIHQLPVPAAAWREWAGGEESRAALTARLARLGLGRRRRDGLIDAADAEPGWAALAGLDAATRMVQSIIDGGGLDAGRSAGALVESLAERAAAEARSEPRTVPDAYWSVRPVAAAAAPGAEDESGGEDEQVLLRGAVLVRCRGRRAAAAEETLSPELAAAIHEPPSRPGRTLWRLVRSSGTAALAALAGLMVLAAGGVVFEALLFRGFFDVGRELGLTAQRFAGIGVLVAFLAALLLLEWPVARGVLRLGRQLETRLRIAFLAKIPRLGDRYFRSRLTSDLASRCHNVHRLRLLPELGEGVGRTLFELLLTTAAIVWLDPGSLPLALAAAGVALVLPLLALPWLTERDLREREHAGALSRFYLDALLGLVPLRTHGAQRAVEREHESLLVEWVSARLGRERMIVGLDLVLHPLLLGLVGWLLVDHLARRDLTSGVLLLVFWSLNLFNLGRLSALLVAHQYPSHRSIALRLLEPLGAPDEAEELETARPPAATGPVSVRLEEVAVRVAGHGILQGIDLEIAGGEHVAIVGPSGAGKSSLVGLFLGWYRPASGRLLLDGEPLGPDRLAALRHTTAWVDPQVQLWNRSLLDNLLYGGIEAAGGVGQVVRQAELLELLQELPDGLQTPLGESGALVSGGEGQRVRLARAMLRPAVRLAILDEPFRGLARDQRRGLLARARRLWQDATLLAVTHDIEETLYFDRVLVLEDRRLVEDGRPTELAERPDSAYRRLLLAERDVRSALWADPGWRRLRVEGGRILEGPGGNR
jgi:ATP-binding cassette subfamily B protein